MAGPSPKALIVEDEPKIASLLADYLQQHGGFHCVLVSRGDEALDAFREQQPDIVLLDLMLPGLDGIEVCKRIRAESQVGIIMVTARTDEIDRLLGLELGADDYVCKPFSPREVVARAKAVLRRTHVAYAPPEGLRIDGEAHRAVLHGTELELTPVEFSLLQTLHAHPGRIFTREQLLQSMYSDYRVVSDRAVDTHIKNLRKKLSRGDPEMQLIESVYGLGYRYAP